MTAVFTINWSMCRILQNACSSCRWSGGVTFLCSEYAIFCDKIVRIMRPCLRDSVSVYCNPKMICASCEGWQVRACTAVSSDCSSCHMESLIAPGLCRSAAGLQHCSCTHAVGAFLSLSRIKTRCTASPLSLHCTVTFSMMTAWAEVNSSRLR